MSLNTSHKDGGLLIYNGEMILLFSKEVEFTIVANDKKKELQGTKKGQLFLTTHRIVYLCKNQKDLLKSFSIPFICMDKVELEQPVFGANLIKGHVIAQPNGNWEGIATFKISFNTGGAIEFGKALLNAAQITARRGKMAPPPYEPPPPPYNTANPGMYMPPPNTDFGFQMPTQMFPPNDIKEPVMYSNAPPPYPGIYPNLPNAPPMQNANVSPAYYDPQNPQNIYVPSQPGTTIPGAPPAYEQKKTL
ncbi:unnamed protein product [Gordionus sp. m RMFG-2023]|uniref:WW domain-binding protein 2-like n=1 Tax=Gordionus sp. m RMFG-2023 TaxID=3053472 RepID=UPI0030E3677F